MSNLLILNDEKRLEIIEGILSKAERNFICPSCFKSFKRCSDMKDHIKRTKHEKDLEGLLEKEDATFRRAYGQIIGWEATNEEPEMKLPRERNAAFTREFLVGKIASQTKNASRTKIQICLSIAAASGVTYVCPACVDETLDHFNKMADFDNHCWLINDRLHMELKSKEPATFIPAYLRAIRLAELQNPPTGEKKDGRWTNAHFLKLEHVFQTKWFIVPETPDTLSSG